MLNKEELLNPQLEGEPFLWEGNETGILLMHGLTATPAEVYPLARKLHSRGYTVAGPLLPGHGATPEDLNRVHWRDWLETGRSAYKELAQRCKTVIVGGESTGAVVALYLASENPHISAVLCYAPALKLALRRQDVLKLYVSARFLRTMPKTDLEGVTNWQGYKVNPLLGVIQLLRLQQATRKRLKYIKQPIMIVQGKLDTVIAPECGEMIITQTQSTAIELHWMERSPHTLILEQELDDIEALSNTFISKYILKTE